jgi:hypothetical protein
MLAGDGDRRIGGTADIDRNPRLLHAAHRGRRAREAIVFPRMIHRAGLGPDSLEDVHILVCSRVTLVLRQRVAVAQLIGVIAAGDHVDRRTSAGDLIQRGEFARCQGRRDETRPMRDQEAEAFSVRCRRGREQKTVRPVGEISHQDPIECRHLRSLGEIANIAAIEYRTAGRMYLRGMPMMDHADELYRHNRYLRGQPHYTREDHPVTRPATSAKVETA